MQVFEARRPLLITPWVIFYEEPSLTKSLGKQYKDYQAAVPRWIPQLRKYG